MCFVPVWRIADDLARRLLDFDEYGEICMRLTRRKVVSTLATRARMSLPAVVGLRFDRGQKSIVETIAEDPRVRFEELLPVALLPVVRLKVMLELGDTSLPF